MKKKKRITLCLISAMLAGIMVWRWKSPVNIQDKPYDKEQVSHDTEMTACDLEKEESENDRKPEVMKKDTSDRRFIDLVGEYNETRYEDLITVRYSEEEMQQLRAYMESYAGTYMTARTAYEMYSALEGEYAFECVRETDRGGYILFQGEDGSLLCVDFDNEKLILRNVWICNKFLSLKDFEGVIPYNTKEKEIYPWNPRKSAFGLHTLWTGITNPCSLAPSSTSTDSRYSSRVFPLYHGIRPDFSVTLSPSVAETGMISV